MKDDKTFKKMMDDEYAKDFVGCILPLLILLACAIAGMIYLFC